MSDTPVHELPKFIVRLPQDVKSWIAEQARKNASSQNSEIVRAIRERMEKEARKHTLAPADA